MDVVVAASSNNFQFAVIDFTNPSSPLVIKVNPNLGGSCVVDVDGALAAVGNANGDQVALYDISDPSAPLLLGSVKSGLAGIGALSLDNSRVLAGEANGLRVALLDFTSPGSAKIVSTLVTRISSIGSASLSGVHGVVAGPNDPTVDVLDFTNPAAPTRASLDPSLRGPLVADLDGTQIAIGDQGGSVVVLANAVSRTILGTADTKLPSLGSISIAGSLVTVGTPNDVRIALVDFTTPGSPVVITANPALGGGATVVMGARIAAGAILSTSVKLLQRSGGTLTVLGTANSGISSISTIGIGTFTPPPPKPGKVTVNPTSLSFGNVSVCMSSGPLWLPHSLSAW